MDTTTITKYIQHADPAYDSVSKLIYALRFQLGDYFQTLSFDNRITQLNAQEWAQAIQHTGSIEGLVVPLTAVMENGWSTDDDRQTAQEAVDFIATVHAECLTKITNLIGGIHHDIIC